MHLEYCVAPPGEPGEPEWVTPIIRRKDACLLNGVVRRELLERGLIREADVTMDNWQQCVKEDRDVVGFNGFRSVARFSAPCQLCQPSVLTCAGVSGGPLSERKWKYSLPWTIEPMIHIVHL